MVTLPCPDCGGHIHRSHTRGFNERLVRSLTPYRTYRCHECGWRGWLTKSNSILRPQTRRALIQTGISLLATIILTFLLLYLSNII
ncbi:MAG TPA: hypothetical protein VKA70_05950 [Blastocatellia bacterium]|nr:hypothetical protein [Blastocatellia bacterium]